MRNLSTYVLYDLMEEYRDELKFMNPYCDEYKKLNNEYNDICDELYSRGEFDDLDNYGREIDFVTKFMEELT